MAVQQMMRAALQREIELFQINPGQQWRELRISFDPADHLLRCHHQFEQCRECRDAVADEIQIIRKISDAEFVIFLFRPITGQFIDGIGKPMVMRLPVIGFDEMVKRLFHCFQPACIAGQRI